MNCVTTEEILVARSRSGDEQAFRELYDRHATWLRQHLRAHTPARLARRLSLADLVQEAYATAFQRIQEFEGPYEGSFRRWLARIAEYKAKEAARHHLDAAKRAADRELSRHERLETKAFGGREPTPSAHAMAAETEEAVKRAMGGLPDDYQTVLRLVHEHDLTMAEAGEQMGRGADAARKLYGRAVARLAEQMKKGQSDG